MIQRMTDLENEAKQQLTESEQLAECPPEMAEGPGMAPAPMDQGNPVTMNISMNASGKDHVADLIGMMKNAGLGDAQPATDAMMPMRQDMERLSAMMDEPKEEGIEEGGMKDAVTDMQEQLHDFAQEIQKGMHSYDNVVDELNDMFDEVKDMGDPIVTNAFKVLRSLEPEDFGEGEGGGPNRASMVAQDAMDMIDGSDDSDYDHLPKIGEGRMSDQVIHDSETMTKEEFAKKHGKEMADEYFESSVNVEEAIMVSAEGGEAAELLAILQNAGMPAPAMPAMPEPEMDMQDEYSNSPDEVEMDLDAVIASGDDLHRDKEQFAAAASGDNPMKAFEGKFQSILDELLAEDDESTDEVVAEEVEETTEEAVAVNESAEFSEMKHFMQRLNG